jgi:hypothetical protein
LILIRRAGGVRFLCGPATTGLAAARTDGPTSLSYLEWLSVADRETDDRANAIATLISILRIFDELEKFLPAH